MRRFFQRQRWVLVVLFLAWSLAAAYLFQDAVREIFLQPLSFLWWQVNILYRSVAQIVYWAVIIVLVLGIAASSLLVRPPQGLRSEKLKRVDRGQLEELAWWLEHTRRGTYFRWRVAHRLAELSVRVNERDDLPRRIPAAQLLSGRDWSPPAEIQEYLVAGLERRFVEPGRTFAFGLGPRSRSPYDVDVEQVIAYLESRMETNRDRESS